MHVKSEVELKDKTKSSNINGLVSVSTSREQDFFKNPFGLCRRIHA
jgi:hypothetical protein